MPDFKKNSRGGDARRSFSRDNKRGPSFERKELYAAECNKCHKACQVPFRPNGKKPVYCRDCFTPDFEREYAPRFDRRASAPKREYTEHALKDPRIDEVLHRLDSLERTLEKMTDLIKAANRKEALSAEVRKHLPEEAPAEKRKKATKKIAAA